MAFERAWTDMQPRIKPGDYDAHRRQRGFTAWKYRMHDAGTRLPTQFASGVARCFCGAEITIAGVNDHIAAAHMDMT